MNESNNKLFRCGNYNFEGTYEMRDINEFLKRAILQKHPRRDALETVDVVRGDDNNNNNNNNNDTDDDDDDNGGEYPITLRATITR